MAKRLVLNGGKPWSVAVGVAYGRTYEEAAFVHALFAGLFYGREWRDAVANPPALCYLENGNDALVPRSRNLIGTRFLEHEAKPDVLLTLDTDINFNPLDVILLAEQAHREQAVYCGLYVKRSKTAPSLASWLALGEPVELGGTQTSAPIHWGATGCMTAPRAAFVALSKTLPLCNADQPSLRQYPFYMDCVGETPEGTTVFLSEDFAFCERARAAGFGIFANPSIRLAHIGNHPFTFSDLIRQPQASLPITAERLTEWGTNFESQALNTETAGQPERELVAA